MEAIGLSEKYHPDDTSGLAVLLYSTAQTRVTGTAEERQTRMEMVDRAIAIFRAAGLESGSDYYQMLQLRAELLDDAGSPSADAWVLAYEVGCKSFGPKHGTIRTRGVRTANALLDEGRKEEAAALYPRLVAAQEDVIPGITEEEDMAALKKRLEEE